MSMSGATAYHMEKCSWHLWMMGFVTILLLCMGPIGWGILAFMAFAMWRASKGSKEWEAIAIGCGLVFCGPIGWITILFFGWAYLTSKNDKIKT